MLVLESRALYGKSMKQEDGLFYREKEVLPLFTKPGMRQDGLSPQPLPVG